MKETTYQLTITFQEPILGSQPTVDIAQEFLAKKAGLEFLPEDEMSGLPEALERGTTVFHRDEKGNPVLFDYMLKGFLKASAQVHNGQVDGGVKALKSKVNNQVFVTPRMLKLHMPEGEEISYNSRPLRAETPQGPRVAIARSEQIPAGTALQCGITVLGNVVTEKILRELLDYGYWQGLGQWRNGGWGRFTYKLVKEQAEEEEPVPETEGA